MCLALGLPLTAQTSYILTASPSNVQNVVSQHGLTVVKELYDGTNCVMLVTSASADVSGTEVEVESDLRVVGFEPEQRASLPELSSLTQPVLTQSSTSILDTLPGRTLVTFFGSTVPSNYTTQAATSIIRLGDARTATHLTGSGVVAIIDTGADPNHPALSAVLVPGYDFTRDIPGFSELADLNPTVAAQLQQSSTSILDAQNTLQLNGSAVAILNQSSTSILDQSSTSILDSTLAEFGHGTMTAGIVHLIAPTANIMPLKAFRADGSSNLSDIIRAIYYAADHGANIISMSFSMPQSSPGLQAAIQYALNKNVATGRFFRQRWLEDIGLSGKLRRRAGNRFQHQHRSAKHILKLRLRRGYLCGSRRRRYHHLSWQQLRRRMGNIFQYADVCRRSRAGIAGTSCEQAR